MRLLLLAAGAVAAYIILQQANDAGLLTMDPEDQTGSIIDQLPTIDDMMNTMQQNSLGDAQATKNRAAFLECLRFAEGTLGDEGYRALFGWRRGNGKTFGSFAAHPRQFFTYTDLAGHTIRTSAAGAYQITATTCDLLNAKYPGQFDGFTPEVQDAMALTLIEERGALVDIDAGRFAKAINKVRRVWASLPGSDANQPTRAFDQVAAAYTNAGGVFA